MKNWLLLVAVEEQVLSQDDVACDAMNEQCCMVFIRG